MMELTNLVLDEELDALNGSGGSLGDGSGDTTHCCPMLAMFSLSPRLLSAQARERHQCDVGAASKSRGERTHEVNDEAGHAHELLLALAVMDVSMFPDGARLLKLDERCDGFGALLTRHPWSRFQRGQTFCRCFEGVYDGVERVMDEAGWQS
jgi:hypothetical protein